MERQGQEERQDWIGKRTMPGRLVGNLTLGTTREASTRDIVRESRTRWWCWQELREEAPVTLVTFYTTPLIT